MGQPFLDQQNFRFGKADGSESAHTFFAALNTNVNAGPGQTVVDGNYIFLRFTIANTGAKAADSGQFTVEMSYNSGGYSAIGSTGAIKYATNPTYLTHGNDTTDRLGGTGTFDTSNFGVIEGANTQSSSNILTNGFREEILIVLQFDQSQAQNNGDTYDIRVAGMDQWSQTARITIANLPTATLNQTGYRFTSQDGTLASPTWQAAANTNVTLPRGKNIQLWVEVEEASGASVSTAFELTWQKNGAGGYTTLQGRPWISPTATEPAVYGVLSEFYTNDDAITSNPINQSAKTFVNGVGVESDTEADVESSSRTLNNQCTVLCFTIRIPSLYGTTTADVNEKNDYFDFQLRRANGTALDTTLTARYTLGDGNGHIGGCPAETQGKWGPFKDSNGNLYYITERSEFNNHMCMMKSPDDGVNWYFTDSDTGLTDLESVDAVQVGDTIWIAFDGGGAVNFIPYYTSDHATTPDTFGTNDIAVASKTENDQGCALVYRPGTADFVLFYRDGTTSEEIWYIIGTSGSWSSALQLDSTNVNHIGIHVVKEIGSDWIHIFYTTEETVPNTIRHRSMNPSTDALTTSEVVYSDAYDGGSGWQWAMTSAIAWQSGANEKVGIAVYDDSDNYLYFVSITDDGSPSTPVQIDNVAVMNDPNWMTSRSPIARLFVDSNGILYCIMADASTQDLWIYTSDDDGATWSDQTTPEEILNNKTIEMVIGQALTLSGTEYLAFIYADRYGGFDDWVYFDTYTLAAAGITGTLSETLAALASTTVGDVYVDGDLSETLAAVASTTDSDVLVDGSLAETLEALTSTTVADLIVKGSLAETLEALILTGVGTSDNPSITGTLSQTLAALSSTTTSRVYVDGTLTSTLGALALTGAGEVFISGSLAQTLAALVSTADGDVYLVGTLDETLGTLTLTGAGVIGSSPITGTLNQTLAALTSTTLGDVLIDGALNEDLADLISTTQANVLITGSLTEVLESLSVLAEGYVLVSGNLAETLGALVVSSDGTVFITGDVVETLGDLVSSTSGSVDITGSLTETLGILALEGAGTGQSVTTGQLNQTLASLTLASSGEVFIDGSLSKTLGAIVLTGLGDLLISGSLEENLGSILLNSLGKTIVQGVLSETLEDATITASGQVHIDGALVTTFEDLTINASGLILAEILGNLNVTLDALVLDAYGTGAGFGTVTITAVKVNGLTISVEKLGDVTITKGLP